MSETGTPGDYSSTTNISVDHAIARDGATVVAFVGRALRGPVNRPISLSSFAEFQTIFGGLWQDGPLSYAVEHFFEQGGIEAVIVRVINGGQPPTLSLPCTRQTSGDTVLTLQALTPGSHEFLRAAVDYDNLGNELQEHRDQFNLVIQRIRDPHSERIEVQETFRRVSVNPETQRFIANVLMESKLVRVLGAVPTARPNATDGGQYYLSNQDGSDGQPLSDYDIIGSMVDDQGIFALRQAARLSLLYIPPLSRQRRVGMGTLLVADRLCREQHAMLIVDPPMQWRSADEALAGLKEFAFHSSHALMCFPNVIAMDRLQNRAVVFGNGGVVAGLIARHAALAPVWAIDSEEPSFIPRAGVRLASSLSEIERWRLTTHGINALRMVRNASNIVPIARTLAGGVHAAADFGYLRFQRLACFIVSRIEHGTRWAQQGRSESATWRRIAKQVTRFLQDLASLGAFPAAHTPAQAFMVVCDERTHTAIDLTEQRINILIAFSASREGQYHCFIISQSPTGSSIKRTAINPLQLPFVVEPWLDKQVVDSDTPLPALPRVHG